MCGLHTAGGGSHREAVRTRKFRKMVYDKYFDSAYLETDRKKQELEAAITTAFKKNDLAAVDKLCGQLEELMS